MKTTKESKRKASKPTSYNTESCANAVNEEIENIADAILGRELNLPKDVLDAIRESCDRFLVYAIAKIPPNAQDEYEGLMYVLRMDRLKRARLMQARIAADSHKDTKKNTYNKF